MKSRSILAQIFIFALLAAAFLEETDSATTYGKVRTNNHSMVIYGEILQSLALRTVHAVSSYRCLYSYTYLFSLNSPGSSVHVLSNFLLILKTEFHQGLKFISKKTSKIFL